MILSVIYAVDT